MSQINNNPETEEIERSAVTPEPESGQANAPAAPESETNEQQNANVSSESETEQANKQPEQKDKQSMGAGEMFIRFGKAAWAYIKHARIELIVLVAIVALDLITKALVAKFMYLGQSIEVLPKFLYISYLHNTKAAFGSAFGLEKVIGDDGIRIIFIIITLIAMGVFSYILYRCRKRHFLMRLSIAMILAGALGNFIDRVTLHYVRDFIEFVYFGCDLGRLGTSFPVFNVADMALTIGVVIFLVYFILIYKEPKSKAEQVADSGTGISAGKENPDGGKTENADSVTVQDTKADTDKSVTISPDDDGGENG